jgi:glycine cleavage system H lipoate-binding protein
MNNYTKIVKVYGFQVPTDTYYLHRGHAWVKVEYTGQVRVGLDDFSQKILGPADELKLPAVGKAYYQDHICMSLVREGRKASVLAPVDGIIEEINPKICQTPSLIHDDPYGEGWLFLAKPTNLQPNLDKLCSGEDNATWINQEAHRLLSLMGPTVTLPDGGDIVDDVYGHYPALGWKLLVKEFYLPLINKGWKKR